MFVNSIWENPSTRAKVLGLMRRHPLLLELNAHLWLRRLANRHGRPLSLSALPDHLVKEAVSGFDTVWLMGAWTRTAASRTQALGSEPLRQEFDRVLPGWTPEDVGGSPYAVGAYVLDPALGAPHALADFAAQLGAMGRALIVDFVPNHLAMDHEWTLSHPERFVKGDAAQLAEEPTSYFRTGKGAVLAHGKDPYFAAWSDTVQVNIFHAGMRQALVDVLMGIATVADGVRCDMAMLLLNDVFERTWQGKLGNSAPPAVEFWQDAIARVKERYPNFVFIAEAYWGTEGRLVELGFDYVYDKTLYDRLLHGDAESLRGHLNGQGAFLRHGLRFVENHDEPRAATAFAAHKLRGAALASATLPGMRMFHEGQFEGRKARVPVQLLRTPAEVPDEGLRDFYRRLVALAATPNLQRGHFTMLQVSPASPHTDDGHTGLVAWAWWLSGVPCFVVLNQSDRTVHARLKIAPNEDLPGKLRFTDPFSLQAILTSSHELNSHGFPIEVGPRQGRVFTGLAV